MHDETPGRALVVGATGVAGSAVLERMREAGFDCWGVSRRASGLPVGVRPLAIDITDADQAVEIARIAPTHVFFTAWSRQPDELRNIEVNVGMLRNVLDAASRTGVLEHVALLTGLKQYIGPPELQGSVPAAETPFREDAVRLPVPMFYYDQEDALAATADRHGFRWSVHRAHTIAGYAVGNAMNLAATLGAQAALCRETDEPFRFPGSHVRWDGLGDLTDAGLLADHMHWAATDPSVPDGAYNVVNGDVFRWRWMWPRLAGRLGVEWEGPGDVRAPLQEQMTGKGPLWRNIAQREGLIEPDIDRVASWWHADGDLGRGIEMLADMSKSRRAGFAGYRESFGSLAGAIDRYEERGVLPRRTVREE